jgi:hypothetical protein
MKKVGRRGAIARGRECDVGQRVPSDLGLRATGRGSQSMRTVVARQVEQFVGAEVGGGYAMQHAFQRRLARLGELELRRHKFDHAPARQVAAHQRVKIVLELPYLIDRPILRQRGEGIRNRAGVVVVERRLLAPPPLDLSFVFPRPSN